MWWSQPGCRGWRLSRPLAFTLRCERVQPQAACDEPGCGVSASDNIIAETASHCICVCTYMASAVCVYGPRWCAYMASAVCIHTWRRWCAARRESACINSSLSTLGRCLQALRANSTAASSAHVRPVPYRECKLTHLFKDILHGEGALALLVCVSPLAADYEETHHVLKYAALASKIKVALPPPVRCVSAPCGPPVSVLGVAFEPSVATFESVVVAGDVPQRRSSAGKGAGNGSKIVFVLDSPAQTVGRQQHVL